MDPISILKGIMTSILLSNASYNVNNAVMTEDEVFCMAQNIYHEASNQPLVGMIAVAHVTRNRAHADDYPQSICGVVTQGEYYTNWQGKELPVLWQCQFTWQCDGKPDDIYLYVTDGPDAGKPIEPNVNAWIYSIQAAILVMLDIAKDPTNGATHYYNPALANPEWGHRFPTTAVLGNHVFVRKE